VFNGEYDGMLNGVYSGVSIVYQFTDYRCILSACLFVDEFVQRETERQREREREADREKEKRERKEK
jgi:hypothetical protein